MSTSFGWEGKGMWFGG